MHRFFVLTLLSLALALAPDPARAVRAANYDSPYRRAFEALDDGHADRAMALAAHGHDAVLNKVLLGYYMAQPGNTASFNAMAAFVSNNPDWPGLKGILAASEAKIPASLMPGQVVNWLNAHPPQTLAGFNRYIDALAASGQTQNIKRLIAARWMDSDLSAEDQNAFRARYGQYLDVEAHWARLDRLLWKNDIANAHRMYPLVDAAMRATAEARLALASQNRYADIFVSRVPEEWQSDPGLLYERLRWDLLKNRDGEALEILRRAPEDLGKADAWWEQRAIMIRRLMDERDYPTAYELATLHGQIANKQLTEGEFLAGWLALRFLNDPEDARVHFQRLYDNSSTPISRARGAYWLGRSYEALGERENAVQAYQTAAALNITYYGQLAIARLDDSPVIHAMPEPAVPQALRQAFYGRDVIRAVERLYALGEHERARTFFHAAMDAATQRSEFSLLTELAYQIGRPDLAIEAAKAANQKNILMASGGFPVLDRNMPHPPEPALIHALIRQESMFNPDAASPAGAHGLMQLMPHTAKDVARKLGIRFSESRLENTDYNLRLGTTFFQNQLAIFSGSYVLALAGYNAGPARVREWMRQIGDPRSPEIDPVDWIESMPVAETRNYVQRIIESLQVYRARLNGGTAPLLILKDLKR